MKYPPKKYQKTVYCLITILLIIIASGIVIAGPYDLETLELENRDNDIPTTEPQGIFVTDDGTKMFYVDENTESIYQYALDTSYNTSSKELQFTETLDTNDVSGLDFNNDGTKLYVVEWDSTPPVVAYEYKLEDPYNVSNMSLSSSYTITDDSAVSQMRGEGIEWGDDGNKLYFASSIEDSGVIVYDAGEAYDLSTISFSHRVGLGDPVDMRFNDDGSKLYLPAVSGENIDQYNLTTNYNVTTAMHEHTITIPGDGNIGGVDWANQDHFYVTEYDRNEILHYKQPFTPTVTLNADMFMKPGDTQTYTVERTAENGSTLDITDSDSLTVESSNASRIVVQGDSLIAQEGANGNVQINATFTFEGNNYHDNITIFVGGRTIDNIENLPPEQYIPAALGFDDTQSTTFGMGSEIQWVFLAILIGSMASWKARNEYIGIGVIIALIILFWINGSVSLGITLVALFYGIFIGYLQKETPSRSDTNVGGFE